jgi:CRISPR-associated endonuclease Csn1
MAEYVLGLDVGTSSIGWAVIDEANNRIIDTREGTPGCGIRHFQEPIDPKKNTPNNTRRREKRGARRVNRRRARRRRALQAELIQADLLPADANARIQLEKSLNDGKGDSLRPGLGLYALRRRALDDPVTAYQFGRILLHLNGRRGFKSNRKSGEVVLEPPAPQTTVEIPSKRKQKKTPLYDAVKVLRGQMDDMKSRTLGEHLYRIGSGELALPQTIRQEGSKLTIGANQIRGRFILRSMVNAEFDQLWKKQAKNIRQVQDSKLRDRIHSIIFDQRPLRSSKRLIGRCRCIPRLPRCPRASWHAQQFRIFKEVNNLRIYNADGTTTELTSAQRRELVRLLTEREKLTFAHIRDMRPTFHMFESQIFNLEVGPRKTGNRRQETGDVGSGRAPAVRARTSLKGNTIEAALIDAFGSQKWNAVPNSEKSEIRKQVAEADDAEELAKWFHEAHGLSDEDARFLATLPLPKGYMSYSLEAIKNMLDKFDDALDSPTGIKEYEARERCGYNKRDSARIHKFLPLPIAADRRPITTNPLVNRALHEVRKVVNAVIREYGGEPKHIVVELWREMKGSLRDRTDLVEQQNANRDERERIRKLLKDEFPNVFGDQEPSGKDVFVYRLWCQQGKKSPYSEKCISATHLLEFFGGRGVLHVDHIIPRGCLDDSQNNKCLCFLEENQKKGKQTPREWKESVSKDDYEQMLARVAGMKEMPLAKRRRFSQSDANLNDYVARQMNDTAFIACEVRRYLQCLYPADEREMRVKSIPGHATAGLRWNWGIDAILGRGDTLGKNRADLRHHAIDAIVVAMTNAKRLWLLANTDSRRPDDPPAFEPWPGFRNAVEAAVHRISVSHRVHRRIRGQLHDETHYGSPDKESGRFPYRKPLTDLTWAEIPSIRDKTIRELVESRLTKFRKHPNRAPEDDQSEGTEEDLPRRKPPAEAWNEPLFLRHADGSPATVVRRVRLMKRDKTIRLIRKNSQPVYVKPGSNHHLCLFKDILQHRDGHERDAEFVTLLDAMERKVAMVRARRKADIAEAVVRKTSKEFPGATFWMSLSKGEMVLFDGEDRTTLYRFETAPSTSKQMVFRKHYAAAIGSNGKKTAYPWTLPTTACKVTVDPLGRIRWAND